MNDDHGHPYWPGTYVLDDNGEPLACYDTRAWGWWMQHGNRKVARTTFGEGRRWYVSTVFLDLDHNLGAPGDPVLWETMVFGGPLDQTMRRYCHRADALVGHQEVVREVLDALTVAHRVKALDE